jgi:peptidyl-prolyl cis-trans isomerase D
MISTFRSFAKSPAAIVLFGLLLVSFAVFGISDVFRAGPTQDAVVQAGSRTISRDQFKQMFQNYLKQLSEQNQGQPVTVEDAVANGVDRQIIENLAYSESLAALVTKMGLRPSDTQVVEQIRQINAFFDPISGKFDRATYQQRLREAGLTEPQFEAALRDEITQGQIVSGLAAGLQAPKSYAAALAAFSREGRDVQWFTVAPRMVPQPAAPTDAQLTAYIKANAARFTKPELRQITMVRFSPAALAPTVAVDPTEVQKRFEFERESLSKPELRSFVQIPVKDAAAATNAANRLRAGEDPAAVAKALGVQPVTYADAPKTSVSDRAVADAAFAMKEGEIRAPVQGSLGLAVVKITKVTPGQTPTLDQVRPQIEAKVRQDAATEKVYEQVQKYEEARNKGSNLAEAAKAAGAVTIPLPVPITAQGTAPGGQPLGLPVEFVKTAFDLPQGGESEVKDAGQGEYYALRVEKITPSALATLDEAREAATQLFTMEELRKRLQARADELAARVRKGEALDAVAKSAGATVARTADLRREGQAQTVPPGVAQAFFAAKKGDTVVTFDEQIGGVVVGKIDNVVFGAPAELARDAQGQQQSLRNMMFNDMGYAARNAARDKMKPRVDYARAREALGLEPLAAPATPAAPAPEAKK